MCSRGNGKSSCSGPCDPCKPCAPCSPCGPCPIITCGPNEPTIPCGPSKCFSCTNYCQPRCSLPSCGQCEVPVPLPPGADNWCVSPPLPEGGVPDPRVWNNCYPPTCYPCYL